MNCKGILSSPGVRSVIVFPLVVFCLCSWGCAAMTVGLASNSALPVTHAPVIPPFGFLYSNIKIPLTHEFTDTPFGSKEGIAEAFSVGIPFVGGGALRVAWGDGSIASAARQGGIDKVHFADYTMTHYLFFFTHHTTHVYGD